MLSATLVNPETLSYPVYVSPKLDGLRCLIKDGVAVSRNLKPFRNKFVQAQLAGLPDGLDGELIVGSPTEGYVLNRTQSGIMSSDGEPDFTYWVFDNFAATGGWELRLESLARVKHPRKSIVEHWYAHSAEQLMLFKTRFLEEGYEGLMVRSPHGLYKHGRSTLSEGYLAKFKDFVDGEAYIVDVLEGVHNENQLTRSATGAAQRSHHQENKIPAGCIGTIVGHDCVTGDTIQISAGRMTHEMRKHYWVNKHLIYGRIAKYKAFEYGRMNAPRFATFQDFRDVADM